MKKFYHATMFCGLFFCHNLVSEASAALNGLEAFATALTSVAQHGPKTVLKAEPHEQSQEYITQENLKNAIFDEQLEKVRKALDAGADVNSFYVLSIPESDIFNDEYSALGLALRMENPEIIKLILSKNPNLEQVKIVLAGPTKILTASALYEAIELGNPSLVELILKKNPNLKVVAYDHTNNQSSSALQVAIEKGNPESVRLILKKLLGTLLETQEPNDIIKYSYWANEEIKKIKNSVTSDEWKQIEEGLHPTKNNLKIEFKNRKKILDLIERAAIPLVPEQEPEKTTKKSEKDKKKK